MKGYCPITGCPPLSHRIPSEAGGSLHARWVPRQSSVAAVGVGEPLAPTPARVCPPHLPSPSPAPLPPRSSCQRDVCKPAASSREHFTLTAASSVLCPTTWPSAGRSHHRAGSAPAPPESPAGLSTSVSTPGAPRGKGKNKVGF